MNEKTVLVAEDIDNNYILLEYMLRKLCRVVRARNGQEAIDIVDSQHVDLVFMDLKMPVMNGIEATKIIKEKYPDLPVVAVTAHVFDENLQGAREAGCKEVLSKPVDSNQCRSIVKEVLGGEDKSGSSNANPLLLYML